MKPQVKIKPAPARPAPGGQERRPHGGHDSSPHGPSSLRLFYALKVPPEVAAPLAEAQRGLKGNWRAVRPDQLHVTLSYLPAAAPGRVEELRRLGQQLVRERPPLDLRLRGTGYFPNEGSPRVWFVKVESGGLTELAEDLRAGVRALGVGTDDLPFRAHITLARKKGPAPRVPPLLFDLGWTAPGLTLYRSILRKTGPIYEVQSTFRFRGGAAPPDLSAPDPSLPAESMTEVHAAPGAQEPT